VRVSPTAGAACISLLVTLGAACGDTVPPLEESIRLLVDVSVAPAVPAGFREVTPCKHSHEHDLHHIRIFVDDLAGPIYDSCMTRLIECARVELEGTGAAAGDADGVPKHLGHTECAQALAACRVPFPEGARFLKYEYEHAGCEDDDLGSIVVTERLADDSYPNRWDWRWQRIAPDGIVEEDGAPGRCLNCHIDHCGEVPYGWDLRCVPD
jgi:hypothetical protein